MKGEREGKGGGKGSGMGENLTVKGRAATAKAAPPMAAAAHLPMIPAILQFYSFLQEVMCGS